MRSALPRSRRARASARSAQPAVGSLLLVLGLAACAGAPTSESTDQRDSAAGEPSAFSTPAGADEVSVVAVGDLVCESGEEPTTKTCQQRATAELAAQLDPTRVIALGDLQYQAGAMAEFDRAWRPTWGRFDDILTPVPGNHEYETDAAAGYRSYFDTAPYYARRMGGWRVYLLDSNCDEIDCSQEAAWLGEQLAGHPPVCTAIAMHHPRVSSGAHGNAEEVQPLWQAAVRGGVDLALSGHDHDYERFARLDAQASPADPAGGARGIAGTREFVVGTGGKSLYDLHDRKPGSEFFQNDQFGVLDLTLRPDGFDWEFVGLEGTVLDQGGDTCSR